MIIDPEAMCKQARGESEALYIPEHGKSYPTRDNPSEEVLETLYYENEQEEYEESYWCDRINDETGANI